MKSLCKKLANARGFSFLEVMVALVLTGVVTAAVFETYVVQHEQYMAQDDIANVQQNSRAALAELTRHLRMAGFNLPAGVDAIIPANTNPDTITIVYRMDNCQVSLDTAMAAADADIQADASVACFQDGQWAYIFHPDSGGGEWFQITALDSVNNIITPVDALTQAYWDGSIVITMNQVKFFIDNTTDAENPSLMMQLPGGDPQIYAENISDLQFVYNMDGGMVLDEPVLIDQIGEVVVGVTAQSSSVVEAIHDERRSRTFETCVFLRNNGI